ncbi:MAG: type IV toxin-antitoxin system AbiEi family antitoxin domain-containing protein [Propionibacteriaceae bacterium]|nr:type IV toxin-antitoxin system AbiEi family antitoxin domain-containing protein [Propionibacteriaceae bacterium]
MDVTRAGGLLLSGYSRRQLTRLAQRGEIVRVRHGAYADSVPAGELERHTQLIAATWPAVDRATVLSHGSAAVLHGLPVWTDALARVTVIRRTTGHGSRRTSLHVRLAALRPDEVVSVDGYQVTSLERTGCDLACILRYERAVAVLDAVLHRGGDPEVLAQTVGEAKGRRGAGRARAALIFADGRSESVAESVSRVRMSQVGIPSPQLQVNIFDENGTWVARSDFGVARARRAGRVRRKDQVPRHRGRGGRRGDEGESTRSQAPRARLGGCSLGLGRSRRPAGLPSSNRGRLCAGESSQPARLGRTTVSSLPKGTFATEVSVANVPFGSDCDGAGQIRGSAAGTCGRG